MAGTHDDGRLFGFDGVNMWTEPTLGDSIPGGVCSDCGPVEHLPIPEDESHCLWFGFYGTVTLHSDGTVTSAPCACECHARS
jgi:hypothetical protein